MYPSITRELRTLVFVKNNFYIFWFEDQDPIQYNWEPFFQTFEKKINKKR